MNTIIGILGNDLKISTLFVEKIILNTKADTDQEHIKMNIVINNNLFNKNKKELLKIIDNFKKTKINYLVLTFDNQNIYEFIKENINIPIIKYYFNELDDELISNIIKLAGKETKK